MKELRGRQACAKSEDWQNIESIDHGTIIVLCPFSAETIARFNVILGPPETGGVYTCEPRMAQGNQRGGAQDRWNWEFRSSF